MVEIDQNKMLKDVHTIIKPLKHEHYLLYFQAHRFLFKFTLTHQCVLFSVGYGHTVVFKLTLTHYVVSEFAHICLFSCITQLCLYTSHTPFCTYLNLSLIIQLVSFQQKEHE